MPLVVRHSLADNLNVIRKGDRLGIAPGFEDLYPPGLRVDLPLESLEFFQILILDSGVLNLNRIQFLLILLCAFSEPGCELFRFLRVQCFAVFLVRFFVLNHLA